MSISRELSGGRLNCAVANAVVGIHSRYAGRGPNKAQAFFWQNFLVLVLGDAMTKSELTLVANGRRDVAMTMRRQLEEAMRDELAGAVQELTGCRVLAVLNANHVEPDVTAHLFVLDRPPY